MSPCSLVMKQGKEKALGYASDSTGVEARSSFDWKMTGLPLWIYELARRTGPV